MPLKIIRDNITNVKADIIVNTANPKPIIGAGTDSAIYKAAGEEELLKERKELGDIDVGNIGITKAYNLNAKFIFHAVGPAYIDGHHDEEKNLKLCYDRSLIVAHHMNCHSIAFPLISSGTYCFPKKQAFTIAVDTIKKFLIEYESDLEVILVIFDPETVKISRELFDSVSEYIDDIYAYRQYGFEYRNSDSRSALKDSMRAAEYLLQAAHNEEPSSEKMNKCCRVELNSIPASEPEVKRSKKFKTFTEEDVYKMMDTFNIDKQPEKPFKDLLMDIMIEKGLSDHQVYENANITKQTFNKIKNRADYHPGKHMVLALALSLQLTYDETIDFLARANYAVNPANIEETYVLSFIKNGFYDIVLINYGLDEKGLPLLNA